MQSNNDFGSRLPMSKTVNKTSMNRPTFGFSQSVFRSQASTALKVRSTYVKPDSHQTIGNTIGSKIVRPRIGALSTMSRMRPYPNIVTNQTSGIGQIAARLDFDNEALLKSSPPLQASPKTLLSIQNTIQNSPILRNIFDKNQKKSLETKATSPAIDWTSVTKDAELAVIKTKVKQLEDIIEDNRMQNSQMKCDYELKIDKLSKDIEREKDKHLEMEKSNKHIENKCQEFITQLNTAREEFGLEYEKYEKKIQDLQKRNNGLIAELSDTQMTNQALEVKNASDIQTLNHQLEVFQSELINCGQEKEILVNHIEQIKVHVKDTQLLTEQLHNTEQEISDLKEQLKAYREGEKLSEILQNEIKELKKFKDEHKNIQKFNEDLKEVYSQNLLLQEKIVELELELNSMQNESKATFNMDVDCNQCTELKKSLSEWQQVFQSESPSDVSEMIDGLKTNVSTLTTEMDSLKDRVNQIDSEKYHIESDLRLSQNELIELKKTHNEQTEDIKKYNRKITLLSKEIEMYKNTISSYEHDVTIDINKSSQERITQLETTLSDYRLLLDQTEIQLKQLKDGTKVQELEKEKNELRNEVLRLRLLNEELQSDAKSDPQNSDLRVIHLKQNPLAVNIEQQNEEFKRLIDENRRLTTKIQLLENGCDADTTRQIDEGIKKTIEVEELKQKLSSAEKRQKNIIEAFKKTSKDFREVCYILTGYRIDFLKQSTYRLSHMLADSPNDVLLFERSDSLPNKTIKLLENEYSEKLKDSIHTYLTQHDSYPAFLASLTLDLFQKQTHFIQ